MPIVNGSYSPPNNFTQQYNLGQKKIRADLVDENFNDAAGAINTLLQADANSVHKTGNETINGNKTFTGKTTFNGDVDMNGNTNINGPLSINGSVDLGNQVKVAILQSVFPVGSIYTSTNGTNPAALFGFGTWEQIQGRMILGVSGNHPVGQMGGEEAHTLSWHEMPAHTHNRGSMEISGSFSSEAIFVGGSSGAPAPTGAFSARDTGAGHINAMVAGGGQAIDFYASRTWTGETSAAGANYAHNNMPPFYAAYIWRRTA